MKEIRLLSLLLVVALFVQSAAATTILPYSSSYQGRSYFNFDGVTGHVDFAVYDTQRIGGDEWTGAGFTPPGSGQYIYAYQIFNDAGSDAPIEFFSIMGLDEHVLDGIYTMNTQDPWGNYQGLIDEGVAPTNSFPNTNLEETRATWEFDGGILVADEYSWFLVFSSANPWTLGTYDINPLISNPTATVPNPEPCTLVLLGLGGTILFAKRKNSAVKRAVIRS